MKTKSKPVPADSTRERLLAAGRKLFAMKPYDQVAIDGIAREAGVAHGLLFHYFKSKLGFYLEVYRQDRLEILRQRQLQTSHGTPDERLRKFVNVHMEHVTEWSGSHLFILRGGAPAKVLSEAEKFRMIGVREVLGYFSDEPPTQQQLILGRSWLGLMGELFLAWLQDRSMSREGVVETCVQLYYETMKREDLLGAPRAGARKRKSNGKTAPRAALLPTP
jgi:AcrR family transcriptional regulator